MSGRGRWLAAGACGVVLQWAAHERVALAEEPVTPTRQPPSAGAVDAEPTEDAEPTTAAEPSDDVEPAPQKVTGDELAAAEQDAAEPEAEPGDPAAFDADPLAISGIGMFGLSYITSFAVGYTNLDSSDGDLAPLMLPAVGPFISIATTDMNALGTGLLVGLGGLQIAGLVLIGVGFGDSDEEDDDDEEDDGAVSVSLGPAPPGSWGVGLRIGM